jgi:hypothetical protein
MTVEDLLDELFSHGIAMAANGDLLRVDSPAGAITAELRRQLGEHKSELLKLLRGPHAEGAEVRPSVECRTSTSGEAPAAAIPAEATTPGEVEDAEPWRAELERRLRERLPGVAMTVSLTNSSAGAELASRISDGNVEPSWVGQAVPIDDLPELKKRWGLRTVGGGWAEGRPCPELCMEEME